MHLDCTWWSACIGHQKSAPDYFFDFSPSIDAAFFTLSLVKIWCLGRHISQNAPENTRKKCRKKIVISSKKISFWVFMTAREDK